MDITHLELFLIPELIEPQTRHELPPGVTSGTCEDVPYSSETVIQDILKHNPQVTLGEPSDIIRKQCNVCDSFAPIICHRQWDGDCPQYLEIEILTLCYQCPRISPVARYLHHFSSYNSYKPEYEPPPPF